MADYDEDIDDGCSNHMERKPLVKSHRTPRDKFHIIFFIIAFLGLASLLPWNFFINAKKYFDYKFRNTSLPSNVSFDDPNYATQNQVTFESLLSIVSNGSNLLFSFFTVIIVRTVSVKTRIISSSVFILIIFVVTTVMVKVNTDSWQDSFFVFTLVMAAFMSGAQSVLTSSVLGLSAIFPPIYSQAAMNGQAAGGTFSSVVGIVTHWAGGGPVASAFIYFLIAIGATIMAIVAYISMHFSGFAKHHMAMQAKDVQGINNDHQLVDIQFKSSRFSFFWNVFRKIWIYCLSLTFVFCVTLALFPGVCSLIKTNDEGNKKWDEYFMFVACFLLFNVGDLLGRLFTFVCKFPGNHRPVFLLVLTILRVALIPLLMLCNAQPRYHLPVVFHADFYPIILILIMGLTNGYLGTLCFSFGPVHVNENETEVAGIMLAVAMTLGLATGSFLSIGLVKLI